MGMFDVSPQVIEYITQTFKLLVEHDKDIKKLEEAANSNKAFFEMVLQRLDKIEKEIEQIKGKS